MDGRTATASLRAGVLAALAATTFAACSSLGTTALSFMRKARESPDPNIRYQAYARLSSPSSYDNEQQKADAVHVLVDGLEPGKEPVATRAVICQTLGSLRRPEARDAILKATEDSEPVVRVEALRALGKVGRPEDATILAKAMTVDTQTDCRIAAIEALGDLKATDPRIPAMLVDGMEHDNPAIRLASVRSLRKLTGRDLGVDVGPWRKLVQAQEAAPKSSGPTRKR